MLDTARLSETAVVRTVGGQLIVPDYEVEITWARGAIATGPEDTAIDAKDEQAW